MKKPELDADVVAAVRRFAALVCAMPGGYDWQDDLQLMTWAEFKARPKIKDRLLLIQRRTKMLAEATALAQGEPLPKPDPEEILQQTMEIERKSSRVEEDDADGCQTEHPGAGAVASGGSTAATSTAITETTHSLADKPASVSEDSVSLEEEQPGVRDEKKQSSSSDNVAVSEAIDRTPGSANASKGSDVQASMRPTAANETYPVPQKDSGTGNQSASKQAVSGERIVSTSGRSSGQHSKAHHTHDVTSDADLRLPGEPVWTAGGPKSLRVATAIHVGPLFSLVEDRENYQLS